MIALFDVDYQGEHAQAACIVLEHWHSPAPFRIYTRLIESVKPYEAGSFYKRELPCIIAILETIEEPLEALLIDGHVWVGDKPGLGYHLYLHCHKKLPVVGVAKNAFKENDRCKLIYRGESKKPLYVSAVGLEIEMAEVLIQKMPGPYRMPDMLKEVDRQCRNWSPPRPTLNR